MIRRSTALLCVWRKYGGTIPGWRQDFRVISPFFKNMRGRSLQSLFFFFFWLETTRFFFLFKSINTIAAVGDIFLEKAAVSVSATTKKEPTPSRVNAAHYGRSSENVNNRKLERNPRKIKEKSSRSRFRLFAPGYCCLVDDDEFEQDDKNK